MAIKKQDTSTGNTLTKTPILASENAPMVADGTPAQATSANASIRPVEVLSLLQADLYDLQKLGCRIAILARDGGLYASIIVPGHALGLKNGHITLDSEPVVKG